MLRLTALGGRLAAIGFSGAVHAAIFLTPPGHPPTSGRAADDWSVDVSLEAPPPPPAPTPPPEPTAAFENHEAMHAHGVPHTHTHPYPVPASHDWIPHDPSLEHPHDHEHEEAHDAPSPAPATEAITAAQDGSPRFAMAVSTGAGLATSGGSGAGTASNAVEHDDGSAPVPEQAVDQRARLRRGVPPTYPSGARAAGVEAKVELELVVSAAGSVEQVHVQRPAGHGLDEAAVAAARQFLFTPAVRHGHAVRVRMPWSVEFRLD